MILDVPVAQGTERLPSKQRVAGSNPAWDATSLFLLLDLVLRASTLAEPTFPAKAPDVSQNHPLDSLPLLFLSSVPRTACLPDNSRIGAKYVP